MAGVVPRRAKDAALLQVLGMVRQAQTEIEEEGWAITSLSLLYRAHHNLASILLLVITDDVPRLVHKSACFICEEQPRFSTVQNLIDGIIL